MKADAWMPFYPADYLRKTMRLTRDQHGGYFLLLLACWDGGGRLPNDPDELAAIVKASPAEWRKLAPKLLPFFEVEGEFLVQKRVLAEHEKAARLSEIRRETGAKGGRPKKEIESNGKPNGFANANQTGSQNETPALVAPPPPLPVPSEPVPPTPLSGGELTLVGAGPEADRVEIAFNAWNDVARRCGLPVAKSLDKARRRAIEARLAEAGIEGWAEAIGGVEQSAFCRGQRPGSDGRTMRADLGFVCQAKSFPRLREGFYGTDAKVAAPPVAAPTAPDDRWRRACRRYQASQYWNTTDDGPKPGKPGCLCPAAILAEFGLAPPETNLFPAPAPGKDAA